MGKWRRPHLPNYGIGRQISPYYELRLKFIILIILAELTHFPRQTMLCPIHPFFPQRNPCHPVYPIGFPMFISKLFSLLATVYPTIGIIPIQAKGGNLSDTLDKLIILLNDSQLRENILKDRPPKLDRMTTLNIAAGEGHLLFVKEAIKVGAEDEKSLMILLRTLWPEERNRYENLFLPRVL